MATHMSIRLAWHSEGWNGHICKKPCENTFCIGQHSYPGDLIAGIRNSEFEKAVRQGGLILRRVAKKVFDSPCCIRHTVYYIYK